MAPIITALIVATLFLGGTKGFGLIPGQLWFVLMVCAVVFVMLWFRATWPRLRVDQIMGFAWKGLFILAILNLFLIAAEVYILQDSTGALSADSLWLMAGINWAVTIASVIVTANVLGQRRLRRPDPVPSPLANMYAEGD